MRMARERPYRYAKEEDKSRTVILIAVLLALIVLIGGGLLFLISQKGAVQVPPPSNTTNPPPVNPTNMTNETNVTPVCDDSCLLGRAEKDMNYSECLPISSDQAKQQCYLYLSNVSLDACKALPESAARDSCATAFAVSMKDTSVCDALTSGKGACQLAVNPCFNATDMTMCVAVRDHDPSKCGTNPACILNYSITMKNATSCGLLDPVPAKACESAVSDSDQCSDLPTQANKDVCYGLYATYANDYLQCTQITPGSQNSLSCFEYFAARMRNSSICDYFSLDQKWACLIYYSLNAHDISGCYGIDPLATTNRFACAFNYSIKFGDPSGCEAITRSLSEKSTCYQGSIIYSNQNLNHIYCANVTDFVWSNKCYTEAAKIESNESICSLITADFARTSCQDAYTYNKTH